MLIFLHTMSIIHDKKKFYERVYKKAEFSTFESKLEEKSYQDLCSEKIFALMPHQVFLSHYLNPHSPIRNLLIVHGTGLGKTCSAISIAEAHLNQAIGTGRNKVIIITSASILGEFKRNLHTILNPENWIEKRNQCAGNKYMGYRLTDEDKVKLRSVKNMIETSYEFHTYDKFTTQIFKMSTEYIKKKFSNSTIIIDEIHNIREYSNLNNAERKEMNDVALHSKNEEVVKIAQKNMQRYNGLVRLLQHGINNKLVLLSATPMINNVDEIISIINLFRLNLKMEPVSSSDYFIHGEVGKKEIKLIKDNLFTNVSTLSNTHSPKMPKSKMQYISCPFSPPHRQFWVQYIKGKERKDGSSYRKYNNSIPLTDENVNKIPNPLTTPSMKYTKLYEMLKRQFEAPRKTGTIFIKVSYLETIVNIEKILQVLFSFEPFKNIEHGTDYHRYTVVSEREKFDNIVSIFNHKSNWDGRLIRIIIGTDKMKEGISLSNIESIHIIEPWWNMNKIEQIKGRGIRLCRHIDLFQKLRKDVKVQVFMYISTYGKKIAQREIEETDSYSDFSSKMSYDEYTLNVAKTKQKSIEKVMSLLQYYSIDGKLNSDYNKNEKYIQTKMKKEMKTVERYGRAFLEHIIQLIRKEMENIILETDRFSRKDIERAVSKNEYIQKYGYNENMIERAIDYALYDVNYNPNLHNLTTYPPFLHRNKEGYLTRRKDGIYVFVEKSIGDEGIGGIGNISHGSYNPISIQDITIARKEEKEREIKEEPMENESEPTKETRVEKKETKKPNSRQKVHKNTGSISVVKTVRVPNTNWAVILFSDQSIRIKDLSSKRASSGQDCITKKGDVTYEILEKLEIDKKLPESDSRRNWRQFFFKDKKRKNKSAVSICNLIKEILFESDVKTNIFISIGMDPDELYELRKEGNKYYIVDTEQPTKKHSVDLISKAGRMKSSITYERILGHFNIQSNDIKKILALNKSIFINNFLIPLFSNHKNLPRLLQAVRNNEIKFQDEKKVKGEEDEKKNAIVSKNIKNGEIITVSHMKEDTPDYILDTIHNNILIMDKNKISFGIDGVKKISKKSCITNLKPDVLKIVNDLKIDLSSVKKITKKLLCEYIYAELVKWVR